MELRNFQAQIEKLRKKELLFLYPEVQEPLNGDFLFELKSYVHKIDTSLYHDFVINKTYFNNAFICNL